MKIIKIIDAIVKDFQNYLHKKKQKKTRLNIVAHFKSFIRRQSITDITHLGGRERVICQRVTPKVY